jgi:hypothetical protein
MRDADDRTKLEFLKQIPRTNINIFEGLARLEAHLTKLASATDRRSTAWMSFVVFGL